jgi:flavin-dependent dehydrogenase
LAVECDILIIGGGPAGLWAAKTASDWGFETVVLEEHLSLGHTKHCSGWLLGCGFTHDIFERIQENIKFISASRLILRDALSGDVMEDVPDTGWGGYLVRRELFDRELGKLAIETGAKLLLNVRARSFLRSKGVAGVLTSSRRYPEIQARVTICADGMSRRDRTALLPGNNGTRPETETYPGVQMELANG